MKQTSGKRTVAIILADIRRAEDRYFAYILAGDGAGAAGERRDITALRGEVRVARANAR